MSTQATKQLASAKERARLYKELNSYVTQGGGWLISEPGMSPFRFEQLSSSPLADELREVGHTVTLVGDNERLTGFAGLQKSRDNNWHYAGIVKTKVYEIALPGDYAPMPYAGAGPLSKSGAGKRIAVEASSG